MPFNDMQNAMLRAPLERKHVKERTQAGRTLSYLEGWWVIAEANRIFGFDTWSSETIDLKCVSSGPRRISSGEGHGVTYLAQVRIRVGDVVREGVGTGHGIDRDLGLAHESAAKEAETDARKRALMTFGNPFGLALYDKTQANVADVALEQLPAEEPQPPRAPADYPPSDPDTFDISKLSEPMQALRRAFGRQGTYEAAREYLRSQPAQDLIAISTMEEVDEFRRDAQDRLDTLRRVAQQPSLKGGRK